MRGRPKPVGLWTRRTASSGAFDKIKAGKTYAKNIMKGVKREN